MTLAQFRMLAADHQADLVLRTAPVAMFKGNGLWISVEADLETTNLHIITALTTAETLTGKVKTGQRT